MQDTVLNSFIAFVHSRLPASRARKVHAFNTFFFTKLYGSYEARDPKWPIDYLAVQRYVSFPKCLMTYLLHSAGVDSMHVVVDVMPPVPDQCLQVTCCDPAVTDAHAFIHSCSGSFFALPLCSQFRFMVQTLGSLTEVLKTA